MQTNYCEVPLYGNFFEPLNSLSNLFFLIAAYFLFKLYKQRKEPQKQLLTLSIILTMIGLGSFAWHFYPATVTVLLDVIPIMLYLSLFLYFFIYNFSKSHLVSGIFVFLFFLFQGLFSGLLSPYLPELIQGAGASYAGSILFFLLVQTYTLYEKRYDLLKPALLIVGVFSLSLFLRQVDHLLCSTLHFGTHPFWHFFNAIGLYLLAVFLVKQNLKKEQSKKGFRKTKNQ